MLNTQFPETIWKNARIQTMDETSPVAEAFAVSGARIVAVGSQQEILALAGPDTVIHDLGGHFVYPGFIEGHIHLAAYGDSLLTLPIRDRSRREILDMVRECAAKTPAGQWILGGMGWNNEVWDDPSYPTLAELDAAAPDHPVMLPRMDGHLIWANSLAYRLAGVSADTPNPARGEFMRNPDGSLQGCASNAAADIVKACIPPRTAEQRQQALLAAQAQLLRFGVTSVNDMSTEAQDAADLKALYESGDYRLRFHGALRNALGEAAHPDTRAYLARCPEIGLYDDHFTIRACKLLGDGSVGAQSAALKEDFSDRPGHRGLKMYTDEQLYACVRQCAEKGMQVIIHAIGDDTIDQVLRVYRQVLADVPVPDHRWHIEHFQTAAPGQPETARALGVWVSMQPMHAPNSASMALRRLGEKRASRAYAGGLLLRKVGKVSWGSDAPVATPAPLSGIHAAITRTNDSLSPAGGFFMENAVSPMEALLGYTVWGAEAQFTERDKGSIEAGKLADFVVLDRDLLQVGTYAPDELLQVKVLATVIGGRCEYRCDA